MHKKTVEVVVKHFCTKLDLRQRNVFPQWFQRTRRTITTCKGAPVGPLSSKNKTEILNFRIVSAIIGHDLHIEYLHKNPVGMIRKQSKGLLTFSPRNKNSNLLDVMYVFLSGLDMHLDIFLLLDLIKYDSMKQKHYRLCEKSKPTSSNMIFLKAVFYCFPKWNFWLVQRLKMRWTNCASNLLRMALELERTTTTKNWLPVGKQTSCNQKTKGWGWYLVTDG